MFTTIQNKFARFRKFIAINIWVQKLNIRGYGWKNYLLYKFIDIAREIDPYLNVYMLGLLINMLTNNASIEAIYPLLLIWIVLKGLLAFFSASFSKKIFYDEMFLFDVYVQLHLANKLKELDWEIIEDPKTEKLVNQFIRRSRYSIKNLTKMHTVMIQAITGIIFAFSIVKLNFSIIGIVILFSIPQLIAKARANRKAKELTDKHNVQNNIASNIFNYIRLYSILYEIKIANSVGNFINKYKKINNKVYKDYNRVAKEDAISGVFAHPIRVAGIMGTYLFPINSFLAGSIQIGTLQTSIGTINRLASNLYRILIGFEESIQQFRYTEYAYDLFKIKNSRKVGNIILDPVTLPTIEFKNVSFKYPGSRKTAIKNVSIKINTADKIALVGENGAGKTTFLKLLLRVYDPTGGEILINGKSITEYKKEELRDLVAYMSQESTVFQAFDVRDNISIYSKDSENINEEKFKKALDMANASDFVSKLKNKEKTLLSRLWNGEDLSGGQKQRLAIARQFYSERPIVILDEPTSAIDPVAESKIFDNLYHHLRNKTVIVVSHRYNTVKAAKHIIVFQEGEIIEQGTHNELVKQKGYYAHAYDVQNQEKKL